MTAATADAPAAHTPGARPGSVPVAAALIVAIAVTAVLAGIGSGAVRAVAGLLLALAISPLCLHYLVSRWGRPSLPALVAIYSLTGVAALLLVGGVLSLPGLRIDRHQVTVGLALVCLVAAGAGLLVRRPDPAPDDEAEPRLPAAASFGFLATVGALVLLALGLTLSLVSEHSALDKAHATTLSATVGGTSTAPAIRVEVTNHESHPVDFVLRVSDQASADAPQQPFRLDAGKTFATNIAQSPGAHALIRLYQAPDLSNALRSATITLGS